MYLNALKITFDDTKEVFLASKEWNSLQLSRKKLDYLHLKNLLIHKRELYLQPPLTTPQRKIIVTYYILNHNLAIETRWWWTIPISRDDRDHVTFAFIM